MTLTQTNRSLYVPQELGRITAKEVMSSPHYATLAQNLQLALENPEVARYYLQNKGVGNWVRTAVDYRVNADGEENNEWVEGPIEIKGPHEYVVRKGGKKGKLYLPRSGWVMVDDRTGLVWNFDRNSREYNGGFATKTTEDKQEAEESFSRARLNPELVSYQWRRSPGNHGLMPVYRFSMPVFPDLGYGPLFVNAVWGHDGLDDLLGCLSASGSEQKASESEKVDIKTYAEGILAGNINTDF